MDMGEEAINDLPSENPTWNISSNKIGTSHLLEHKDPKTLLYTVDHQPFRFSPCLPVISWSRPCSGIFRWTWSWCAGRQGRGTADCACLGPGDLHIKTARSFKWITYSSS
jgi:hypothetical protein